MERKRRLYYDELVSGDVKPILQDTGTYGFYKTIEEDMASYTTLMARTAESVGVIELESTDYEHEFSDTTMRLVGVSGTGLVFEKLGEPVVIQPTETLQAKVTRLESDNTNLMLALVELDAARESDKVEMQLALAELASLLGGE